MNHGESRISEHSSGGAALLPGIQLQANTYKNRLRAQGGNVPDEDRTTTYEVLDHTASGIRLQVEFQRRINASLLASRLPFIRKISVYNETGSDLPGIELSVGLSVESDAARWLACREEEGVPVEEAAE